MKRFTLALLALFLLSSCEQSATLRDDPLSRALRVNGEWTFINYWAEWCAPCIKEIPELNSLHTRAGFRVLGVNFDGEVGEALQSQESKLGVAFPTLPGDPADRFGQSTPQVLPTTLVIDPDGALVTVLVGPQTEDSLLSAAGISEEQAR